jgi:hypothetical protein
MNRARWPTCAGGDAPPPSRGGEAARSPPRLRAPSGAGVFMLLAGVGCVTSEAGFALAELRNVVGEVLGGSVLRADAGRRVLALTIVVS